MTEFEAQIRYGTLKVSEFRNLIARQDEDSETAAFFLLRYRLIDKEKKIYYGSNVEKEFCDVLSDFFFYLRDGKTGKNSKPFEEIANIHSLISFESWILKVFKNFLSDEFMKEVKEREIYEQNYVESGRLDTKYNRKQDKEIAALGEYLAYFDDQEKALERFMLYRSLLAKLINRNDMIPSHEIAPAMGLTAENYRVKDQRIRQHVFGEIGKLQNGELRLKLTVEQLELAKRIDRDFEDLEVIIKELYTKALGELECKDKIDKIRQSSSISTNPQLTETDERLDTRSRYRYRLRDFTQSANAREFTINFNGLSERRTMLSKVFSALNEE